VQFIERKFRSGSRPVRRRTLRTASQRKPSSLLERQLLDADLTVESVRWPVLAGHQQSPTNDGKLAARCRTGTGTVLHWVTNAVVLGHLDRSSCDPEDAAERDVGAKQVARQS
jgi:hypothetical protein